MSKLPVLFFGILATFASAWIGLVAYPTAKLGRLEAAPDEETGGVLPPPVSGLAAAGQKVYASNGCVSCHTQQVRPAYLSTDIAKGLGVRRTVARDYLREQPALAGFQRIGPDLANAGLIEGVSENSLHRYLYEPAAVNPKALMPSFRYLYQVRAIQGQPSADAVQGLTGPYAPKPGFEVVPTQDAKILVAYLLSLKRNYPLPEAPVESAD